MRVVDFYAYPDRSELRDQLVAAFEDLELDEGERTEPISDGAPVGVGYDADLSDDELRDLANGLREQLEALLDEDVEVRFELSDPEADTPGGSPDHLE